MILRFPKLARTRVMNQPPVICKKEREFTESRLKLVDQRDRLKVIEAYRSR